VLINSKKEANVIGFVSCRRELPDDVSNSLWLKGSRSTQREKKIDVVRDRES